MKILSYEEVSDRRGVDWKVEIELPDSQVILIRIPKDGYEYYDMKVPFYLNFVFEGHYR